MYTKIFFKVSLIILGNLFAFFLVGHILDSLFGTKGFYTLLSILISLVPLGVFMVIYLKRTLRELERNYTSNYGGDDNNKS